MSGGRANDRLLMLEQQRTWITRGADRHVRRGLYRHERTTQSQAPAAHHEGPSPGGDVCSTIDTETGSRIASLIGSRVLGCHHHQIVTAHPVSFPRPEPRPGPSRRWSGPTGSPGSECRGTQRHGQTRAGSVGWSTPQPHCESHYWLRRPTTVVQVFRQSSQHDLRTPPKPMSLGWVMPVMNRNTMVETSDFTIQARLQSSRNHSTGRRHGNG